MLLFHTQLIHHIGQMILNGVVAVGHNDDTDSDSDARRTSR